MSEEAGYGFRDGETWLWGYDDGSVNYRDERFALVVRAPAVWQFDVTDVPELSAEVCRVIRTYLDAHPETLQQFNEAPAVHYPHGLDDPQPYSGERFVFDAIPPKR